MLRADLVAGQTFEDAEAPLAKLGFGVGSSEGESRRDDGARLFGA